VAEATPEEAIEAADLNAAPDTVRIGAGEFTSGPLSASTTVDIIGAGREETRIVADPTVSGNLLWLQPPLPRSPTFNCAWRKAKRQGCG
jgi:hypothetical protein